MNNGYAGPQPGYQPPAPMGAPIQPYPGQPGPGMMGPGMMGPGMMGPGFQNPNQLAQMAPKFTLQQMLMSFAGVFIKQKFEFAEA